MMLAGVPFYSEVRTEQVAQSCEHRNRDTSRKNKLHRPHFGDVRKEMTQQILNAVAQRCGRRRAAGAGALHVQIDDAVLEALEGNIATIAGDRRPHPRLDQLLDRGDGFGVGGIEKLVDFSGLGACARGGETCRRIVDAFGLCGPAYRKR